MSLLPPDSFEVEQYRTLSLLMEQQHKIGALTTIAVSSPAPGDGKTITAINLAGTLAQAPDIRVLLICVDLRKPSLSRRLGIDNAGSPGLVEALMDPGLALEDVVRPYGPFNLAVLPSGRCTATPYDVLRSSRLGELLQHAREKYDFVILDTPPLVPVPDCRLIGKWVDGFLLVVAAHKTPRRLLEETLNLLEPPKVIGLIFNRDDQATSAYSGFYSSPGQRHPRRRRHRGVLWQRLLRRLGDLLRN